MVIMKFGGTSVEDAPAIERVAEIVRSRGKDDPVVVVSAFAKVTDQLVLMGQQAAATDCDSSLQLLRQLRDRHRATANQLLGSKLFPITASKVETMFAELENLVRGVAAVRELSLRSSDYLLSFGELLSSEIVTAALVARGLKAVRVVARECITPAASHTRARPLFDQTRQRSQSKVSPLVTKGRIPVLGGFIAATADGTPTTLGRGGSD